MFWHNFKYSFKTLLKNKTLVFWTLLFPIILGIFFHLAFSDIEKKETLDLIDIAVVSNDAFHENKLLAETLRVLSDDKNEQRLFQTSYVSLAKAQKLLKENKVIGYVLVDEDIHLTVNSNGVDETVFAFVMDEIKVKQKMMEAFTREETITKYSQGELVDYEKIYRQASQLLQQDTDVIHDISNQNLSYTMIEYYTLIAMACLYGGMLAMYITNYKLANMNCVGKRTSISPVSKGTMLLGSLCASYLIQLIGLLLLFLFTIFVLHVDYGNHLLAMILLACCGSLAGLSLGIVVATLIKTNENAKTGILIAITMCGCFFSGMMGITMKYIIDKNIPLLNKLNPASMITDGFYALYYYDHFDRFLFDVISLLLFSLVMMILSFHELRRQTYDHI